MLMKDGRENIMRRGRGNRPCNYTFSPLKNFKTDPFSEWRAEAKALLREVLPQEKRACWTGAFNN